MANKKNGWGFDTKDMDRSVRPQDDFARYAGGGWMKKNAIPPHEPRWGSFTILRHEVDKQLHDLVLKIENKRSVKPGSTEQLMRDFLRSGMDVSRRNKLGTLPIQEHLTLIAKIKTAKDLVPTIAKLELLGAGGIWSTLVDQDMKDSNHYMLYLSQGGLGMPDRDYYLKDEKEYKRVRDAYRQHLEKLLTRAGISENPKQDMETTYTIEKRLAHIAMKKEDVRDVDKTYFKFSISTLQKLAPEVRWKTYFETIGAQCSTLVVMQPKFFKAASALLRTIPIEDWKTYLRTHVLNDFATHLTEELEKENFAFYGTVLAGVTHMQPLWRRVLRVINGGLGEALGKLYVEEHFSPLAKKIMLEMVEDLFAAYEARIVRLDWMSPATKKKAITKLHQITKKIGYPDRWKEFKGIEIRPDDYVGNIIRMGVWHSKRELKKLTKKSVDRKEWFMSPQTVNAYCSFGMNDIVFPAGILQPPFFSPMSDDAINYGSIGSVIGHEITHAFDDQGSKFDGFGNRKTWWTARDRKLFEKKAKMVVQQFNQYRVADGVPVNGQLTLGENIADLGGISIAYDAYQRKLARTGRKTIGGFTPEQRFFLGASLFERELSRPEHQKMQVTTDPHAPAEFRVNGPCSNLPEFYEAFDVRPGDKLYRKAQERAKIW